MLRGLSGSEYFQFERLRRHANAKVIQRAWRTLSNRTSTQSRTRATHLSISPSKSVDSNASESDLGSHLERRGRLLCARIQRDIDSVKDSQHSHTDTFAQNPHRELLLNIEKDVLGLEAVHWRVAEATNKRLEADTVRRRSEFDHAVGDWNLPFWVTQEYYHAYSSSSLCSSSPQTGSQNSSSSYSRQSNSDHRPMVVKCSVGSGASETNSATISDRISSQKPTTPMSRGIHHDLFLTQQRASVLLDKYFESRAERQANQV